MNHGKYRVIISFLVLPVLIYGVFVVSPYLQTFYISLTNWRGYSTNPPFIGFGNYTALFKDDVFWQALLHNGILLVVLPVAVIVMSLFFAFMLNAAGRKKGAIAGVPGSGIYRVVYFFPYVLSVAIVGILWVNIYNPINGLLNGFLKIIGLGHVQPTWLGDPNLAIWAVMAAMVWNFVGFYVVLFTAGMQSIPNEIYEAALLDGAGRAQTFFSVTLPLLWGNVQTSLVYMGILALDGFAIIQIMTNGGPNNSTQVIATYLYQTAFNYGQFGYASAMGVVLFLFTLILAAITLRVTRRDTVEF
ncbi:sugar ABC transporter permease [Saxibacter everestensis]|uniref:Sugar ABC transporter permease n=1 Tax=Saxibacter everestensis TaxID=2909229 RepID=A0ABY8QTH9_9MICO|nr:sugar ABC transporter permease [Brevibacteriaceae bacterium ZFBP1038]